MDALIFDSARTPIGRCDGMLSSVRTDDFVAFTILALMHHDSSVDLSTLDEVGLECADHSGEDNRNAARKAGFHGDEIVAAHVPQPKGSAVAVKEDERPRPDATAEELANLNGINGGDRSVTIGNSSGIYDGAAANPVSSGSGGRDNGLTPVARVVGMASAGVLPCVMRVRPALECHKLLDRAGSSIDQIDVIEIDEAFASQGLATLRQLGVADDDERGRHRADAYAQQDRDTDCSDGSPEVAENLRSLRSEHDVRWPWAGYSR